MINLEFTMEEEFRIYELMARKEDFLNEEWIHHRGNVNFMRSLSLIMEGITSGGRIQSLVTAENDNNIPKPSGFKSRSLQGN